MRVPSGESVAPARTGESKKSSTVIVSGRVALLVMSILSVMGTGVIAVQVGVLGGAVNKVVLVDFHWPAEAAVGGVEDGPVDQCQGLALTDVAFVDDHGDADLLVDDAQRVCDRRRAESDTEV